MQTKAQGGKIVKTKERERERESIQKPQDTIKQSNIHAFGIPEIEQRGTGQKTYFKK